jgi:hypothetical protein
MITCNKKTTVAIVAAFIALLIAGPVLASDFTGLVQALRFSQEVASPARVSVLTTGTSAECGGPFYAYENGHSDLGLLWTNALQAALVQGRTVFIQGTGICDGFGIEGIRFIEVR